MCHPRWDETENTKPGEGQWKRGHRAAQNKLCKSRCIQFPNERCRWYRCWWKWWIWNTRRWTGPSGCRNGALWVLTFVSFKKFCGFQHTLLLITFHWWISVNIRMRRAEVQKIYADIVTKFSSKYREIFSETVLSNPRSWLVTETKRLRPDSKRFTLLNLLFPCNILSELFMLMKRMLQIWCFFCQTCHGWWCGICFLWFGYFWFFNKKSSNEKR